MFSTSMPPGLKYAEEIGVEGETNPRYFCYICGIHMDYNNAGLHFTSTAHRHCVLVREWREKARFVTKQRSQIHVAFDC